MSLEHLDSKTQEELETQYMTVEVSEEAKHSDMTLPNLETMPPIKLVALDMDGTTLREDKTFSERLIKVVHKIQEMGVTVAICTGRAPESIQGFAKTLGLDKGHGYCVCFNGGSLINLDDINQDLEVSYLAAQDIIDLEAAARRADCVIHAYSTRRFLLTESNIIFTEMEIASSMQPFEFIDFPDGLNKEEKAYKVIAVGDEDKLDRMRESLPADFEERFTIARTHPNFLEFMIKGCNKGTTLAKLCKILNITLDNVAAFGDAENDIEMVAEAGVGVAVSNAMPKLKAVAKYHTFNYLDDGVACYLEKLFKLPPQI